MSKRPRPSATEFIVYQGFMLISLIIAVVHFVRAS